MNPAENIVGIIAQVVDTLPIIMEAVGARQAMRGGVMHTPMGMRSLRGTSALKRVREQSTADFHRVYSDSPLTGTDFAGSVAFHIYLVRVTLSPCPRVSL